MADMTSLPHPDWPMRFVTDADGAVTFAMVDQDSSDDLQASAAIIANTPRGQWPDEPTFGVTELAFQQAPVNIARLSEELAQSDDRLALDADETADLIDATVRNLTLSPEA